MAARRKVGRTKHGKGRKPPLHVVSDFGISRNKPLARKVGLDRKLRSKGNFGAK